MTTPALLTRSLLATALIIAPLGFSGKLSAASLQWDANNRMAGQTDGNGGWLDVIQWYDGASLPVPSNVTWSNGNPDTATIGNGGTGGTITLGAVTTGGLTINPFSGTYHLGAGTLTLGAGGITANPGSGAVVISTGTTLGAAQSWTNNSSSLLSVTSQVTTGGNALTIAGTGNTTLAGANMISGSGNIVKNGNGTLNLLGTITSGTFTGGVTLNAGTLNIAGIGAAGGLNNSSALGNGTFVINGGTFNNTSGVDANLGYNNVQTWGGDFAFTATNSLNMGTGAVTLTGTRTVTVNANDLTVGGIIGDSAGGFGITKAGAGRLVVSGNNTFTGPVTVNAGIVRATTSVNALGTGAASVVLGGGELQLVGGNSNLAFNRNTTVTANSQITADTNVGFGSGDSRVNTHTMGTLSIGAQTLTVASGANVLSVNNNTSSGNSGITFGATDLTGNATFNILNPTVAPAFRTSALNFVTLLTVGAVTDNGNTATITGNGNFAQTGVWGGGAGGITLGSGYTGTATLSQAANTYTGATIINGGILVANTLANGGLASSIGQSSNAASNLVLGGGTLQTSSAASIDRNFTLTDGTTSTISNSASLTITGSAASSTGSLIKLGAGTLTLAGTNLYTGTTSVNAGNLTLGFSNASAPATNILSSSSALALGGGTLTLTGKASTANGQTFTGTTVNRGASIITATSGGGGGDSMNVQLGAIARTAGQYGTVSFNRPTLGNISTTNTDTAAGDIVGPWATIGGTDYAAIVGGNIVGLAAANTAETAWTSPTGNYAFNGNQTLTAVRDVNTLRASAGTLTLSLGASGANDLTTKGILSGGGGTLTISRSGTSTGVVRVAASTEAVFGGSQAISISAPMTVGGSGVVIKSTTNTLTLSGGVTTLGDATFVNNGSASTQLAITTAPITLGGNLTLAGPTAITLGAGGFDLNNGNRTIFANGTATQTITSGTINNTGGSAGQKLTIGGSGNVIVQALTTGTNSAGVEINGTGVYTFGTANPAFTSGVTLTAGTVLLNNGTGLGTAASTFTAKGGTITLSGSDTSYANALVLDGANTTPINFTSSLEGFLRNMNFTGLSTVQNSPTLNFTHATGDGTSLRSFTGGMTLDSNLTLTGTHTGNVELFGGLNFATGNRTITFNDNGNTTIRGALTGGSNTLTLAGTNQRVFFGTGGTVSGTTGGVIVSGGLVQFGNTDGGTPNTFTGGVTLTGGTIMLGKNTTGPGVVSGPVGTGTLTLLGGSIGNLSDTGGAATIANTLVLDGVNNTPISFINGTDGFFRAATYSGATTIQNAPTLNFTKSSGNNNTGALTFSGTTSLNSNLTFTGTHLAPVSFTNGFDLGGADRTITFNDDGNTSLAGALAGTASTLTLAGSNTKAVIAGLTGATAHALTVNGTANSLFTMTGASTYTGTTTVTGGTLAYSGGSDRIATGAVTVNGATAVLALGTNQSDTVGTVTVDGGGKITGNGTSALTSTGSFEMKSGSVSAILAGAGVALNKTTSGTVNVTGANTYTGDTAITSGIFLANNVTGSATGLTNTLTVDAGATLGGAGIIGSSVAIVDGIVAPGNSGIGTLSSTGPVGWNYNAGSDWKFDLGMGAVSLAAANAATDSDLLNITGNFVQVGSTGPTWVFDFQNSIVSDGWFKLVDWTGSTTFVASDFSAINGSGTFVVDAGTTALYINAVVPEPATGILLITGVTLLSGARRRRLS